MKPFFKKKQKLVIGNEQQAPVYEQGTGGSSADEHEYGLYEKGSPLDGCIGMLRGTAIVFTAGTAIALGMCCFKGKKADSQERVNTGIEQSF